MAWRLAVQYESKIDSCSIFITVINASYWLRNSMFVIDKRSRIVFQMCRIINNTTKSVHRWTRVGCYAERVEPAFIKRTPLFLTITIRRWNGCIIISKYLTNMLFLNSKYLTNLKLSTLYVIVDAGKLECCRHIPNKSKYTPCKDSCDQVRVEHFVKHIHALRLPPLLSLPSSHPSPSPPLLSRGWPMWSLFQTRGGSVGICDNGAHAMYQIP